MHISEQSKIKRGIKLLATITLVAVMAIPLVAYAATTQTTAKAEDGGFVSEAVDQPLNATELAQIEADMAAEKEAWMKQCQADAEFGGQGWEAAQAVIDRGCKQVATQGAVELLQRYNLNTHPEIVRMFYRAGKLAGEDRGAQGGSGQRARALGEAIFEKSLEDWKKERGL